MAAVLSGFLTQQLGLKVTHVEGVELEYAAPGMKTDWWSPTAQGIVYQEDSQSWDFDEVWELVSYTLVY